MLRPLLIVSLIFSTTLTTTAQSISTPVVPVPKPASNTSISDWPKPVASEKLPQSGIDIVTISHPTIRQHCHVGEIKADSVTCRTKHPLADTVYRSDEILALIAPPAHENLLGVLEIAGIVGATLAASFFVPFAWAVTLRLVSGFFFFAGWAANGVVQDDLAAIGYHDHKNDILLYQRPQTPLTLKLHTH